MQLRKIGFLINPIAGMGGSVGLKGTDGNLYYEALKRGAKPVAPRRALRFIKTLESEINPNELVIVAAPKVMGEDYLRQSKLTFKVINVNIGIPTSAKDTKECTSALLREGVEVIVFVGGDGTARDIYEVIDGSIPILGIPSGVKMYSGVFATTPEIAVKILKAFMEGRAEVIESEIADVDESVIEKGVLKVRIFGYVKTLQYRDLVPPTKDFTGGEEENKEEIAAFIVDELMDKDTLYILGPGSTVATIAKYMNLPKTLLGVDAVYRGKVIKLDLSERDLLDLLSKYGKVKIILTPIGKQGFILGRGNQQISPAVLRKVGLNNLIIISTRRKINELKYLRVDTGDPELDKSFPDYIKVITGFNEYTVVKILKGG